MANHPRLSSEVKVNVIFGVIMFMVNLMAIWATIRYGTRRNVHPHYDEEAAGVQLLLIQRRNRRERGTDEWRVLPLPSANDADGDTRTR